MSKRLSIIITLVATLCFPIIINAQTQPTKWKAPKRPKVKWRAPKQDNKELVIDVWRPYTTADNWWLDIYGGTGVSLGDNLKGHGITSTLGGLGGLAIGKQTSYHWSTRFAIEYAMQYGWIADKEVTLPDLIGSGKYKFSLGEIWLDERYSLTNAFCSYDENRKININLFVGIGANYSTGAEKQTKYWEMYNNYELYSLNRNSTISFAMRSGLQAQYAVAKAFDVWAQCTYNFLNDKHNAHISGNNIDGDIELTLGLTMRIADHYGDCRYKKVRRNEASRLKGNPKIDKYYKDEAAKQEARIHLEKLEIGKIMNTKLSFYTDRTYITDQQMDNLRIVANFMRQHPEIGIKIRAYSGESRNCETSGMNLAKLRAETVKDALINNFGIDETRLTLWYDETAKSPKPMDGEWLEAVEFEMTN